MRERCSIVRFIHESLKSVPNNRLAPEVPSPLTPHPSPLIPPSFQVQPGNEGEIGARQLVIDPAVGRRRSVGRAVASAFPPNCRSVMTPRSSRVRHRTFGRPSGNARNRNAPSDERVPSRRFRGRYRSCAALVPKRSEAEGLRPSVHIGGIIAGQRQVFDIANLLLGFRLS